MIVSSPLVQVALAQRRLHLVDAENLVGVNPRRADPELIRSVLRDYAALAAHRSADHVVVGCHPSRRWVFAVHDVMPAASIHLRRGLHGGVLAILRLVDAAFIARTYDALWIASGDSGFTDLALQCRRRGLPVAVVVAHHAALAGSLARAASMVFSLGCDIDVPAAA